MKKNINNLFVRINDKGFMISTLIYGIFIMFIVILSALMVTLNYRKNAFSNITIPEGSGTPGTKTEEEGDDDLYKDEDLNGTDPVLGGLTPVMYVEQASSKTGYWKVVSPKEQWYDYDEQWWANAVSLKNKDKKEGDVLDLNNDVYAMFVWIPKYSYSINCDRKINNVCFGVGGSDYNPGAIDIKFGKENYNNDPIYTGSSPSDSNYYTHPAFTFGTEELNGFWVGKFQTSVDLDSDCYNYMKLHAYEIDDSCDDALPSILPNVYSIHNLTLYNEYYMAQKFSNEEKYGLTGDSHMMKNSEWGAVAYLSQSKYGKFGNNNFDSNNKEIYFNDSNRYTGRSSGASYSQIAPFSSCKFDHTSGLAEGCLRYNGVGALIGDDSYNYYYGAGASTTGNVYGVYDMSGGLTERLMAFYDYGNPLSKAGLEGIDSKYYDKYESSNPYTVDFANRGHATYEVTRSTSQDGWYKDYFEWFSSSENWVSRGAWFARNDFGTGIYALFSYNEQKATNTTFRVSFVAR